MAVVMGLDYRRRSCGALESLLNLVESDARGFIGRLHLLGRNHREYGGIKNHEESPPSPSQDLGRT